MSLSEEVRSGFVEDTPLLVRVDSDPLASGLAFGFPVLGSLVLAFPGWLPGCLNLDLGGESPGFRVAPVFLVAGDDGEGLATGLVALVGVEGEGLLEVGLVVVRPIPDAAADVLLDAGLVVALGDPVVVGVVLCEAGLVPIDPEVGLIGLAEAGFVAGELTGVFLAPVAAAPDPVAGRLSLCSSRRLFSSSRFFSSACRFFSSNSFLLSAAASFLCCSLAFCTSIRFFLSSSCCSRTFLAFSSFSASICLLLALASAAEAEAPGFEAAFVLGSFRPVVLFPAPAFPVLCLISSTETEDAIALLFVFFAPYRTERGACWNAREFTVKK